MNDEIIAKLRLQGLTERQIAFIVELLKSIYKEGFEAGQLASLVFEQINRKN